MLDEMLAAGTDVIPGIGSDIADPDSHEMAYDGAPIRALKDFMESGLAPLAARYGELTVPLLLFTSRQDHVVEPSQSEYLAAQLRRRRRPPLARAQLPRRDAGLRSRRDQRRGGRLRDDGHRVLSVAVLASIPSPSSGVLEIGPLSLNAYGLMIALGVVAAVWLFGRRLEERHIGTRDDANAIGVWGVVAGVIGARLYHVLTDWHRFEGNWFDVVKVWEGGLGIPGGMLAGVLAGVYVGHRRGIPIGPGLNAVAPSLPLAQAIGRWGNYFNQELYGRPTDLPWALEIDDEHLPATGQYPSGTTFHPTFLYESLWNLGLVGLILWLDKRVQVGRRPAPRGLRHGLRRRALLDREPADRRGRPPRAVALEPVGRPRAHRGRRRVPADHERVTARARLRGAAGRGGHRRRRHGGDRHGHGGPRARHGRR